MPLRPPPASPVGAMELTGVWKASLGGRGHGLRQASLVHLAPLHPGTGRPPCSPLGHGRHPVLKGFPDGDEGRVDTPTGTLSWSVVPPGPVDPATTPPSCTSMAWTCP